MKRFRLFLLTDLLFLKVCLAFVIGIISAEYIRDYKVFLIPLLIAFIAFTTYKSLRIARSKSTDILFFSGIIICGILFHLSAIHRANESISKLKSFDAIEAIHWVRIDDKPIQKANSQAINVTLLASKYAEKQAENLSQKIIIYIPKEIIIDSNYSGKIYQIKGKLSIPKPPKYSFEFNYQEWLKRKGIYATMYSREIVLVGQFNSILYQTIHFPNKLRDYYETIIEKYVPDSSASDIAKSLLIGVRTDIDKELYNDYSDTGTIHILSVSGMHFGILILFLDFLLSFFIKNERLRIAIKQPILLIYALMTGFSPPVLRSFLMFLLLDLGKLSKEKTSSYNILFLSAFLILLIDTHQLFDLGFQLSYMAILGIMLFYNRMVWKLQFENKILNWAWQSTVTMFAAWLFTLPLAIFYFHKFSFLGMLSNYIVLPIVVVVMYLGFGLMLLSKIDIAADALGYLLSLSISIQNKIIHFFSQVPLASIYPIYISFWGMLFLVLTVFILVLFLRLKDKNSLRYLFMFLFIFLCSYWIHPYTQSKSSNWYLAPNSKQTIIAFQKGNRLVVFADSIDARTQDFFIEKLKIYSSVDTIVRYGLFAYFDSIPMKYGVSLASHPSLLILCKENKNIWSDAINKRDSFILGANLGYKKEELIREIKSKNKYFVED